MRGRLAALLVVLLFVMSAFAIVIPISSYNVAATGNTYVFYGNTSATASVASNWAPATGPPGGGDNVIWNAASTNKATTWDLAITLATFTVSSGYTGTITPSTNFGTTGNFIPCVTGSIFVAGSYTYSCGGNWDSSTGSFAYGTSTVQMNTASTTIKTGVLTGNSLYKLLLNPASGSISLASNIRIVAGNPLLATNGCGLALTSYALQLAPTTATGAFLSGTGTITGTSGYLWFNPLNSVPSTVITTGTWTVQCDVRISTASAAASHQMSGAVSTTGALKLWNYAGGTLTTNNYAISCNDFTEEASWTLVAGNSAITCSGSWDSSAGTFTQGTSSVRLTGVSKTLKTTGTSSFNKLFLDVGASYTLSSNVITQQYWKNGTLTLNGHTLYVDVDQAPAFVNYDSSKWVDWFSAYSYTFTATDREGETLTFSLTSTLSGLTIGSSSGIATKSAPIANSTYTVTVSISDGNHTVTGTGYALDIRHTPAITNHYYWTNTTFRYWTNTTITNRYWTNNTVTYRYWSNVTGWVNTTMWIGSSPDLNAIVNETYSYQPTASYLGNSSLVWNMTTNATGLSVNHSTGQIIGKIKVSGAYFVNLTATAGAITVWQNWTLMVGNDPVMVNANLVLALVFGFGLIILAFIDRKRTIWPVFAGFVWIVLGVVILYNFGNNQAEHILWMVLGVGVGLILMLEGSMAYAANRKQGAG